MIDCFGLPFFSNQEVALSVSVYSEHELKWSLATASSVKNKQDERDTERSDVWCNYGAQFLGEDFGAGRALSRHEAQRRVFPLGRFDSGAVQPGGVNEQQICE